MGLLNKKKTNILLMGKLVMSISFTLLRLVFDSAFTIIYLRFEKISWVILRSIFCPLQMQWSILFTCFLKIVNCIYNYFSISYLIRSLSLPPSMQQIRDGKKIGSLYEILNTLPQNQQKVRNIFAAFLDVLEVFV